MIYPDTYQHPKFTQKSCYTSPSRVILAKPPPSGPFWITQIDRKSHPSLDSSSLGKDDSFLFPIYDGQSFKIPCFETTNQIFHIPYIFYTQYMLDGNIHSLNVVRFTISAPLDLRISAPSCKIPDLC